MEIWLFMGLENSFEGLDMEWPHEQIPRIGESVTMPIYTNSLFLGKVTQVTYGTDYIYIYALGKTD